jgi:DNA-binding SARP family transcriptional activator
MIEICLFGVARVYDDDRQLLLMDFRGVKPRHVLLLLTMNLGYPLSKERLADSLWHGDPPPSWVSTLEGYVSLLRRSLAAAKPDTPSVVLTRDRGYVLDPSRVQVDLNRFDKLLNDADSADTAGAPVLLAEALDLVRGDVLAGERNEPWVVEARDRYRHRVCRAAVKAGRFALQERDLETAVRYGQLACDLDPLAEDGWHIVIEAQWRAERRSDAVRSFSRLRSLLERELGVAPCRSLQQLFARVLRDEPYGLSA